MPLGESGHLASEYGNPQNQPPKEDPFGHSEYRTWNIGGVQIAYKKGVEAAVAYLRWNEGAVFAATIDGQHRLAALRRYMESTPLTRAQMSTRIPIIFLVFDENLGFHLGDAERRGAENPLLSIVREVFIDLNKHAVDVAVARQVLLDDQEIEAGDV